MNKVSKMVFFCASLLIPMLASAQSSLPVDATPVATVTPTPKTTPILANPSYVINCAPPSYAARVLVTLAKNTLLKKGVVRPSVTVRFQRISKVTVNLDAFPVSILSPEPDSLAFTSANLNGIGALGKQCGEYEATIIARGVVNGKAMPRVISALKLSF